MTCLVASITEDWAAAILALLLQMALLRAQRASVLSLGRTVRRQVFVRLTVRAPNLGQATIGWMSQSAAARALLVALRCSLQALTNHLSQALGARSARLGRVSIALAAVAIGAGIRGMPIISAVIARLGLADDIGVSLRLAGLANNGRTIVDDMAAFLAVGASVDADCLRQGANPLSMPKVAATGTLHLGAGLNGVARLVAVSASHSVARGLCLGGSMLLRVAHYEVVQVRFATSFFLYLFWSFTKSELLWYNISESTKYKPQLATGKLDR